MAKQTGKPKPGQRREVRLPDGGVAEQYVDSDPDGNVAARVRRLDTIELLYKREVLTREQYLAGWQFQCAFERCGLGPSYAMMNADKIIVDKCPTDIVPFKDRGRDWQDVQAGLRVAGQVGGSALWYVVGCGFPVSEWVRRMRTTGVNYTENVGKGVLIGALDALAVEYGS